MTISSIKQGCLGLLLAFMIGACSTENPAKEASVEQTDTAIEQTNDLVEKTAQKQNILFFGNSLTAGYGLDEAQSFPSLIQNRLDSLGYNYQATNAGLSGETTAGGLNRIDWVLKQPIDIFVLELGANDVLRGFDLTATRSNLKGILDEVETAYPEAKIILAGMEAPPNMGEEYRNDFRQIYVDLAKEKEAGLIPFLLDGVAGIPALNLQDGVHPNAKGQYIVRENVWRILETYLEK